MARENDDYDTLLKMLSELESTIKKEYERLDRKVYETDRIFKTFENYKLQIGDLKTKFNNQEDETFEELLFICKIVQFNCSVNPGEEYYEEIGVVDK